MRNRLRQKNILSSATSILKEAAAQEDDDEDEEDEQKDPEEQESEQKSEEDEKKAAPEVENAAPSKTCQEGEKVSISYPTIGPSLNFDELSVVTEKQASARSSFSERSQRSN